MKNKISFWALCLFVMTLAACGDKEKKVITTEEKRVETTATNQNVMKFSADELKSKRISIIKGTNQVDTLTVFNISKFSKELKNTNGIKIPVPHIKPFTKTATGIDVSIAAGSTKADFMATLTPVLIPATDEIITVGSKIVSSSGKTIYISSIISIGYQARSFVFLCKDYPAGDIVPNGSGASYLHMYGIEFDQSGISTDDSGNIFSLNTANKNTILLLSITSLYHKGTPTGDGTIAIGYVDQNPVFVP